MNTTKSDDNLRLSEINPKTIKLIKKNNSYRADYKLHIEYVHDTLSRSL